MAHFLRNALLLIVLVGAVVGIWGGRVNADSYPRVQPCDTNNNCANFAGGGMAVGFPYGNTAAQTATSGSFVGVAGSNGTTVDPLLTINGGQLRATLYNTGGNAVNNVVSGSDTQSNTISALNTAGFGYAFNGTTWDRIRKDTFAAGNNWVTTGGSSTNAAITAGLTGPTVIKGTPGRLMRALITTAGTTGTVTLYDNASACSGTIIGLIPGTTAVATAVAGVPYDIQMPAANGITACGGVGSAAVTVSLN